MTRAELEQKVYDIAFLSMQYLGEMDEIREEIKQADDDTLKEYIRESEED